MAYDLILKGGTVVNQDGEAFVRGRKVMWQGAVVERSQGEPVKFLETLPASNRS